MKKEIPKVFGSVLKETRLGKKLSQQELADYSEVSRGYISQLELGNQVPTIITIFKLAEVLKVKPHDLISLVEQRMK